MDCGYSKIEEGCLRFECQTWEPGEGKPTHPKLEIAERYGHKYWTCPKCGSSYGEVPSEQVELSPLEKAVKLARGGDAPPAPSKGYA